MVTGWKHRLVMEEGLPARLLLTFDPLYIPHVHLVRNHGANIPEESDEVRSHRADQTLDLMRKQCEACHCLLFELITEVHPWGTNQKTAVKERQHMLIENFDH